jgi:hypothetical protein
MLRYEASIRELFYRSCTADRSFVPQDDRELYVIINVPKFRNTTKAATLGTAAFVVSYF